MILGTMHSSINTIKMQKLHRQLNSFSYKSRKSRQLKPGTIYTFPSREIDNY